MGKSKFDVDKMIYLENDCGTEKKETFIHSCKSLFKLTLCNNCRKVIEQWTYCAFNPVELFKLFNYIFIYITVFHCDQVFLFNYNIIAIYYLAFSCLCEILFKCFQSQNSFFIV